MRKDIDMAFVAHPLTGDLATKTNESAVKQSIKNIVLTSYYERGFYVEFGTPLKESLFELVTPQDSITIRDRIDQAIKNFEPQAELIDVFVRLEPKDNSLHANVIYTYVNNPSEQSINIDLERIR